MTTEQTKPFQVGSATFGDGRLTIIGGPCVIESREHAMMTYAEFTAVVDLAAFKKLDDEFGWS